MSVLTHRPGAGWAPPMPAVEPSDEDLVRRVRAGDRRSFEQVYERYKLVLHRYCHSIVRQREDAEEAFQATMLSAFQALTSDDERQITLRPWLYRIAHNECISTLRRRRRHEAVELDGAEAAPEDVAADTQLAEDLRQLRRDLAELPERERSALVMRELGGLSHVEIGRALGEEPAHVKQLIYQARVALHDLAAGRELACQSVRRTISDGDGRALRGRSLRAHLRACAGCRDFQAAIGARPARLAALAPVLPAAVLGEIMNALGGAAAAAGGTAAAGAGGGLALASGATAAAGAAALGTGAATGGLAVKLAVLGSVALIGGGTAAVPALEAARDPAAPELVAPAPATRTPTAALPPAPTRGSAAPGEAVRSDRPERSRGGRGSGAPDASRPPGAAVGGAPALGEGPQPPAPAIAARPAGERSGSAPGAPPGIGGVGPAPVVGREPAPLSARENRPGRRDTPAPGAVPVPTDDPGAAAPEPGAGGPPGGPTGMVDVPASVEGSGRPPVDELSAPEPPAPAIVVPEAAPDVPAPAGPAPAARP